MVADLPVGGGLVVDDGERGRDAAFLVEDHVGAAGDGDAVEVQLEGALGLPDPVQVGLVLLACRWSPAAVARP